MKLKKIASLMLAGIMAVSMLAGCKSDSANGNNNDDNTVVVPSTSAVVTALNNGQSADNDVKVAFSSNASFDAALKKAVENAGNYDDGTDVLTELLNLLGEKNDTLFDGNSSNSAMKDGMAVTVFDVVPLGSSSFWTEEDAVNYMAREMNDIVAELAKSNKKDGAAIDSIYYDYSYTGNAGMVAVEQEGGSTIYYFGFSITQTAAEKTVEAK